MLDFQLIQPSFNRSVVQKDTLYCDVSSPMFFFTPLVNAYKYDILGIEVERTNTPCTLQI